MLTDDLEALMVYVAGGDWKSNPHLERTPERFLEMLKELTTYEDFHFTTFDNTENVDEMVVVHDIPFHSLCAHHIIPFFGRAHVAYIPNKYLCGISKLARLVRQFARNLNVQEHLTQNIADYLDTILEPKGVAVVMEAEHLCMTMRGVQAAGTKTTTSKMTGVFLDPAKHAREEFLTLTRSSSG